MGKLFKIIASLVLLMLAAVCILPFVINLNNFKPEIIAAVKNSTRRELTLDGELKLSLFPWAGISTGKMALSNAPGFEDRPFATIEESKVEILLLPLLSKKIEIDRIGFKGLVLNLAKNKEGINNWADLAQSGQAEPDSASAPAPLEVGGKLDEKSLLAAFAIGGISIEDAHINWDNQKTGQHLKIKDLNLNTDKFAFDAPVGIAASLTAESKSTLAVKINTELSVNKQLDTFALRHSDVQVTASGETVPGKALSTVLLVDDVALDMAKQTAKIHGLLFKLGDLTLSSEMTGSSIKDNPSFQGAVAITSFSPANVMRQLSIAMPAMQDANALSKLSVNFDLAATPDSINLQNLTMLLDDSQIIGSIGIKDFTQQTVGFNLAIDSLDLDRYLPVVDKSSKPFVTPGVLLAAGISILPVETLRKFNTEGTIALGKLKASGLTMQDSQINLNAKNGVVTAQQSIKQFYQGSYSGNLSIDTLDDKSMLTIKEKIDHAQIEPLVKDYTGKARISGIVNASAQLQGEGSKASELKASLNGNLSFLFKDGTVKGFNLQKIIDEGKSLVKGAALPADHKEDQTVFSEMSATATITQGLIQNNDLVAKSANLRVDGKGSLNLNTEALDYKVNAKLLNSDPGAVGEEQVKATLTVNITGTLSKPSYTLDIASLLTDKNKAKINKLIDKIDKKVGSGIGDLLKGLLR